MSAEANIYTPGQRLRSLDVLRGIAILGTLGTNIFVFVPYFNQSDSVPWYESVLSQLTNGKFLALLTLMFGIGLTIQYDSAARRNQRWPLVYFWRGLLLFLDGVLHYILVFQYDVLMAYAITGLIVSYVLITTPRIQRTVFAIAAGAHILFLLLPVLGVGLPFLGGYGAVNDDSYYERNDSTAIEAENTIIQDVTTGTWYRIDESTGEWLESDENWLDQTGYSSASYLDEVKDRLRNFKLGREEAWFIMPMAIALFLLGSFLMRSGLFEPRGRKLRLALLGVGIAAFAWDMAGAVHPAYGVPGNFGRYGLPILVSWGLVAGVAEFYHHRSVGWVGARLEDVGRMALSCYVGQNIICMLLFSSWALDAARWIPDSWGIWKIVAAFIVVAGIIVIWASAWRKLFSRGPLEGLWNWSYRQLSRLTPTWIAPRAPATMAAD